MHVAALLFGLAGVLGDTVGLNALDVTFGRTLFASLALAFAVLLVKLFRRASSGIHPAHTRPLIGSAHKRLLVYSGVLLAIHWVIFFASIHASSVAIGLVTFSTVPVFLAFLEPWYFRERLKPVSLLAAVSVVAGVLIMSGAHRGELVYVKGILLGIASALTFAVLQLVNRKLANTANSMAMSLVQNTVATLVLLPVVVLGLGAIQSNQWWILVFLGVGCTALAHTLFIYSLKTIKAASASLVAAGLEPVYGILLAAILLSQVPGMQVLAGGTIIVATVILMTYFGQAESGE